MKADYTKIDTGSNRKFYTKINKLPTKIFPRELSPNRLKENEPSEKMNNFEEEDITMKFGGNPNRRTISLKYLLLF